MSSPVLVGYATRYGSTREVADAIGTELSGNGLAAEVRALREVQSLDDYGAVVVGAPLQMFRWHPDALRFLSRRRAELEARPVAIFALGPVRDPYDAAEWQNSQSQLDKALAPYTWLRPVDVELFGGKYAPDRLGFFLKLFAGKEPATDIRDWEAIRKWAAALAPDLGRSAD